ncbi:MAG: hypothetical protein KAG64_04420 [Bacteroidales bacterium]|nr:hypothetical protein [Bacteroidales bacterium]
MNQKTLTSSILLLLAIPFISFGQSKADTTVSVTDSTITTTVTTVIPVEKSTAEDTTGQFEAYMTSIDTTSLGSNLNLQAVAELFRTSKDLEEFEKRLNDKDEGVNNLDLNEDGETDYLRVVDHAEKNTHVIVIQAVVGKDKFQDVASIDVVQDGDKITLQIVGDEDIYGTDYYIEPEKPEEVENYPTVQVIFVAGYSPYYSPYYWGYYPPYYHPWPPYPPHYYHRHYYHRHYHHHHHYHHGHNHMNPHARSVYHSHRTTAPINKTQRYNNNTPQRPVNKTQTRPATSPSTKQSQPANKSNKQQQSKAAKPSHNSTQPSTQKSNKQSQPKQSQPKTHQSQPKQSQPSTRQSQPRQSQPRQSRPAGRPGRR